MTSPHDAAIEALRNAFTHSPENIGLATELIRLLVELMRYDDAEATARLALQHHLILVDYLEVKQEISG